MAIPIKSDVNVDGTLTATALAGNGAAITGIYDGVVAAPRSLPTGTLAGTYTFDSSVESWDALAGNVTTVSGRLRINSTVEAFAAAPSISVADLEMEADAYANLSHVLIFIRYDDTTDTGIFFVFNNASSSSPGWYIIHRVAGEDTVLEGDPTFYFKTFSTNPLRVFIRAVGASVEVFLNGSLVILTEVAPLNSTAGRCGFGVLGSGFNQVDNVKIWTSPTTGRDLLYT